MFYSTRKGLVACVLLCSLLTFATQSSFADQDTTTDDAASDNSFSAGVGYAHDTGTYGSRATSTTSTTSLTLDYSTDNYQFEASLPYTKISGPAGNLAGRTRHRTTLIRPSATTQGVGDSTLSVTRDLWDNDHLGFSWDLGASAKLATGDVHRGLGSGANDYTVSTDVSESIKRLTLQGTVGYTWYGSKGPTLVNGYLENLRFKDGTDEQLDGSLNLFGRSKVGLNYSTQQPTEGKIAQKEATAYLSLGLGKQFDLYLYALKGYTRASPDRGYGLTLSDNF